MKKYLVLLLVLSFVSACGKKYDTIDTQEEADKINVETKVKNETVIVPDKVYFGFDSAVLNAESKKTLDTVAEWLNSKKEIKIILEGHCDERGTREYNLALGQKRAEAAKKYLVSKNVNANRVKIVSYGKEKPEFLGTGESVWSKNRRAVVVEVK
ncbi:MAG: peptidoglycan-associated lipoprotein Pal [Rickettsiales bacterium]|nr:peptidoglycan-associated lipoprotein Pal [Rickettsiales bacterium]